MPARMWPAGAHRLHRLHRAARAGSAPACGAVAAARCRAASSVTHRGPLVVGQLAALIDLMAGAYAQ